MRTINPPDSDPVPNDAYYADFDNDWISELNVGRASVSGPGTGAGQIGTFITKLLTYEQNPPAFTTTAAMFGFDLDSRTKAEQCKIAIVNAHFTTGWTVTTVYDSQTGNHLTNAIAAMNAGQNIINHADHSNTDVMGMGYTHHNLLLDIADVDALTNGNKQGTLYSMGCDPAAFDENDCIAEHFLQNPNGGSLAFIGNSRYGWYQSQSYNTLSMGYDQSFFHSLMSNNLYHLGAAFSDHKDSYINTGDEYDQYIYSELTLLGDPELPIWLATPQPLAITAPTSLQTGPSTFTVTVTSGDSPKADVTVCLWKNPDVYLTATTDGTGTATFTPDPATPGTLTVTATAQNCLPAVATATVTQGTTPGSLLIGALKGGFLSLSTTLTNNGTTPLTNITWTINLTGGFILIGPHANGTIAVLDPGNSTTITDRPIIGLGALSITVAATADDNTTAQKTGSGFALLIWVTAS